MTAEASPLVQAALDYAADGLAVFPCHGTDDAGRCSCGMPDCASPGKHPRTDHGLKDATTDEAIIRQWWTRWPEANIAINMGASGLVGIDVDTRHGNPGDDTWYATRTELGGDLEATTMTETPNKGFHVWYRADGHRIGCDLKGELIGPGVDVKGEGGYLLVPPSRVASVEYSFVDGHGPEHLGDLPPALAERIAFAKKRNHSTKTETLSAKIREGARDATLISLAGKMRRAGLTRSEIDAALQVVNTERCESPLPSAQVEKVVRSVVRYPPASKADAKPPSRDNAEPCLRCMSTVAPEEVSWLWPRRIPAGKLTLLMGDPGLFKSTLTMYVTAKVTTGGLLPDGSGAAPTGDVVILSAEDGLADTVRPRLDCLGADVNRVWVLEAIKYDGSEHTFSLLDDVAVLERVIAEKHAVLVIIDPLNAYLRGIDSHKSAEVRGALAPLSLMAERTGAAVVVVHHLNKAAGTQNAIYRASGSLDFVAAARSVLGVAPDPDADGRVLLLPVKLNVAAKPEGIGFSRREDGGLEFDGRPVRLDAAEAFGVKKRAESDQMQVAKDFLACALDGGKSVPQKTLEEEAGELGISSITLRRAKKSLKVVSERHGELGARGVWHWRLETP